MELASIIDQYYDAFIAKYIRECITRTFEGNQCHSQLPYT